MIKCWNCGEPPLNATLITKYATADTTLQWFACHQWACKACGKLCWNREPATPELSEALEKARFHNGSVDKAVETK